MITRKRQRVYVVRWWRYTVYGDTRKAKSIERTSLEHLMPERRPLSDRINFCDRRDGRRFSWGSARIRFEFRELGPARVVVAEQVVEEVAGSCEHLFCGDWIF